MSRIHLAKLCKGCEIALRMAVGRRLAQHLLVGGGRRFDPSPERDTHLVSAGALRKIDLPDATPLHQPKRVALGLQRRWDRRDESRGPRGLRRGGGSARRRWRTRRRAPPRDISAGKRI